MKKYTINTRVKNPDSAKYLVSSCSSDDLNEAFSTASALADNCGDDSFVEIVENYSNEVVAFFNKGEEKNV